MEHTIAGLVRVEKRGQSLTSEDESALSSYLDALLDKIGTFTDVHAAGDVLDQLSRFQTDLATACFKWEVHLSPRFRTLVRQFDRSDDPQIRAIVFDSIRSKQFCVAHGASGGDQL